MVAGTLSASHDRDAEELDTVTRSRKTLGLLLVKRLIDSIPDILELMRGAERKAKSDKGL
jgi:hypothetical protein